MTKTLHFAQGELALSADKLIIRDNAKRYKSERIFYSVIWLVFSLLSILRYTKTGDQFLLWSGVIIGVGHAGVILYSLWTTTSSQIALADIKTAVFKKKGGKAYLLLELKNGSTRRINQIEPIAEDLSIFFNSHHILTR